MFSRFRLFYAVFAASGGVMALEVMGLGMLAPYFGTSLIVQTNVLGVVLTSLAIGYRVGGIRADRRSDLRTLYILLLIAAAWIIVIFPFRDVISGFIGLHIPSIAAGSLLALSLLLAIPSGVLGSILPFAIKLYAEDVQDSGRTTGVLYSLSTAGSIVGTVAISFWMLPSLSYDKTFFVVVCLLLSSAILFDPKRYVAIGALGAVGLMLLVYVPQPDFTFHKREIMADGKIRTNVTEWKKLADEAGIFSRLQVYEGMELVTNRPIRFLILNGDVHSGTYLDSNELAFNYARYNRLGGHFNPAAKKALLIGGGGYSYANYFLTDTPLYDTEKVWELNDHFYHNNKTIALPILFSYDTTLLKRERTLVYDSPLAPEGREIEGDLNHLDVHNQQPTSTVTIREADIHETGFEKASGYVHIHETKNDGTPGRIISDDIPLEGYLNRARNIIGKGTLIAGENDNVTVKLDRPSKEGEVLYAMLHRDNGNGHFDDFLVDGYEQVESLDIVEIDPRTTSLAERFFHLNRSDPRLRIFHEDGRTFLNNTTNTYDIIYMDAFRSFYAVPAQLTTLEATREIFDILNDNGVVVANIPASLSGESSKMFQAELKTYQAVFPEVRVYAVLTPENETTVQNIILVAFKTKENIRKTLNDDPEINEQLTHRWYGTFSPDTPLLTDDYAPTDYFTSTFANIHQF